AHGDPPLRLDGPGGDYLPERLERLTSPAETPKGPADDLPGLGEPQRGARREVTEPVEPQHREPENERVPCAPRTEEDLRSPTQSRGEEGQCAHAVQYS